MTQHLLFIDTNAPGIETIRIAKQRGLCVSFIRSGYRRYVETPEIKSIIYNLDNLISLPNSTIETDVFRAVAALHRTRQIDAVICELEPCVDVAARICERLNIPFTSAAAVSTARNKARAREVLQEAGLRCPRFRRVTTAAEVGEAARWIDGPVVIKPQVGYDSLLAMVVPEPSLASQAAERLLQGIDKLPEQLQAQFRTGILVEEYLKGPLVSAEIGVRDGQFYRFMVSDHPRARQDECIEMGASMPADLSADEVDACFSYAESVARALGFDLGIFHAEMIFTSRGPVLVEMNSRLMGGVLPAVYRNLTGESIQDRLIDIHLGLPISPQRPTYAGYVSARTIMPDRDSVLPAQIDLDWVKDFQPRLIEFEGPRLEPGLAVKRRQILGSYHVRAESFAAANLAAEAVLQRFETAVGVPLIH